MGAFVSSRIGINNSPRNTVVPHHHGPCWLDIEPFSHRKHVPVTLGAKQRLHVDFRQASVRISAAQSTFESGGRVHVGGKSDHRRQMWVPSSMTYELAQVRCAFSYHPIFKLFVNVIFNRAPLHRRWFALEKCKFVVRSKPLLHSSKHFSSHKRKTELKRALLST
jgi:hypothetical protein